jgi:rhamnosyltransferase
LVKVVVHNVTCNHQSRPSRGGDEVFVVVVSFNPELKYFLKLLDALMPQVTCAIVVDNASSPGIVEQVRGHSGHGIELIELPENRGIAAAQNAGIERAIALGADFVLLSDQDSIASTGMVSGLLAALQAARHDSLALPVAAVGPATIDRRTGARSFFVVMQDRWGLPRRWRARVRGKLPPFIKVEFLIASGTLIPIEVFTRIGGMRSNYFIDHVDTEWCFRAKAAGYRLLGAPASILEHQLGDTVKRIWFFGWRQVMYHSPLRDYYMFRNTLLMLRDTPMGMVWRIHFCWRLVQFAVYFLGFAPQRWLRLRRMSLGLLHGLRGKGGRLDESTGALVDLPRSQLDP